jgi:hypothetical protein
MAGKRWSAQPGGQNAVSPTHVAEGQKVSTPNVTRNAVASRFTRSSVGVCKPRCASTGA